MNDFQTSIDSEPNRRRSRRSKATNFSPRTCFVKQTNRQTPPRTPLGCPWWCG